MSNDATAVDHPYYAALRRAEELMLAGNVVFQRWTCDHCGQRQTVSSPNAFYLTGWCERCQKSTDIRARGCNYMLLYRGPVLKD